MRWLLLFVVAWMSHAEYIINTLVGGGTASFSGDGGPALEATLLTPRGVSALASGDVFVADTFNDRIRVITPVGTIRTVIGSGVHGSQTSGFAPLQTALFSPSRMVVQPTYMIFTDTDDGLVRKVPLDSQGMPTGVVSTLLSKTVSSDLQGMYLDATENEDVLFVADSVGGAVWVVSVNSGATLLTPAIGCTAEEGCLVGEHNGAAASVVTMSPCDVTLYDTQLWIADCKSHVIRTVSNRGSGNINTVVGKWGRGAFSAFDGLAWNVTLNYPTAIECRPYLDPGVGIITECIIADSRNHLIRRVAMNSTFNTLYVTTIAGNGQPGFTGDGGHATQASLWFPEDISLDPTTNSVYICDTFNHRIRLVNAATGIITTVAGSTIPLGYPGRHPSPVAPSAQLYSMNLVSPQDVSLADDGSIYVADSGEHVVLRMDPQRQNVYLVAGTGGSYLGGFGGDGGPAVQAMLNVPTSIDVMDDIFDVGEVGTYIFIADSANDRIRMVDPSGIIVTITGNGHDGDGICVDASPAANCSISSPVTVRVNHTASRLSLYVVDYGNNRVRRVYLPDGCYNYTCFLIDLVAGNGADPHGDPGNGRLAVDATLNCPQGVAISGDLLYIADTNNNLVRFIDGSGIILPFAGDGGNFGNGILFAPSAIAVSMDGMQVYVAETDTSIMKLFDLSSTTMSTLAGTGACKYSGDGGNAELASLCQPNSVSVDAAGSIYFADQLNNRVRVITYQPTPASTDLIPILASIGSSLVVCGGMACVVRRMRKRRQEEEADSQWTGSGSRDWGSTPEEIQALVEKRAQQLARLQIREIQKSEVKLLERIGQGAFSVVHRAEWRGTDVAVKLLKPGAHTELYDSFHNEAQINSILSGHPRMVLFSGACIKPPDVFMVFNLMPQGNVENVLIDQRKYPITPRLPPSTLIPHLRRVARFLVDASAGILHCHSQGIIHCDVAARNFVVSAEERVHVIDFGMSRILQDAEDHAIMLSTPCPVKWCAPETIREGRFSRQTDVYMFGMFMYEVAARSEPWVTLTTRELINTMRTFNEDYHMTISGACPQEWATLMRQCWSFDPSRRPTMAMVNNELRQFWTRMEELDIPAEPRPGERRKSVMVYTPHDMQTVLEDNNTMFALSPKPPPLNTRHVIPEIQRFVAPTRPSLASSSSSSGQGTGSTFPTLVKPLVLRPVTTAAEYSAAYVRLNDPQPEPSVLRNNALSVNQRDRLGTDRPRKETTDDEDDSSIDMDLRKTSGYVRLERHASGRAPRSTEDFG